MSKGAGEGSHSPIVLLTDFGQSDWYVAEMKGVLLALMPGVTLVDFTHEVPPGDIARAAFLLARGHRAFPDGTVFVVVVDPGVGTARHPLAVHAGGRYYTGPDNGVLEAAFDVPGAEARIIQDATLLERASETFHGRDIFAPVAARLAQHGQAAFRDLGSVCEAPVRITQADERGGAPAIERAVESGRLFTHVAHVDHFGNAITSLSEIELEAWLGARDPAGIIVVTHGARTAEIRGLSTTYGAPRASGSEALALVGSSGLLELAIPGAHSALRLGLIPGDVVEVRFEDQASV